MTECIVVAHDSTWRRTFEDEARAVGSALGSIAVAMHHIGSTAVPGLVAKPIIDMLVEVSSLAELDESASLVEALGYEAKGSYGIAGRRYFRKDDAGGVRTHHLHAFAAGSDAIERHLAFRDYLRAHPAVAREYARHKRRLAGWVADGQSYQDGKGPFIELTLTAALAWRRGRRSAVEPRSSRGVQARDGPHDRFDDTIPHSLSLPRSVARLDGHAGDRHSPRPRRCSLS